mgnify:CR=1 FL=1
MTKVTLENISHSYDGGKTWAVTDVNLTFESGKRYALLGPSGCGKTTILKIICGALKPTKGRIYFDDVDVTDYPPEKRNVAIVFQFPVVYKMSVLKNLLFPLMNVPLSKDEKLRRALRVADQLGIKHLLDQPAHRLGPADRQRVSIGRTLVRDVDLLLLDEPMSSIEPDKRYELKRLLMDISKEMKKTMVFVTHDQTEALTFGEKTAVMSPDGHVLQFATFDEIYHSPTHEFVGFFIGFPGMNIVPGKAIREGVDLGPFQLILKEKKLPVKPGEEVKVGIRPQHIYVSLKQEEGYIPFNVVYTEDLGRRAMILHLRNENVFIKAKVSDEMAGASKVWVKIPERYVVFFDKSGKRIG